HEARAQERPAQVHADDAVPVGHGEVLDQALREDACVVDQNIHAPEGVEHPLYHCAHMRLVRHVGTHEERALPGGPDRLLHGRSALVGGDVGDGDVRTLAGEPLGDTTPDAASAAGYDGDLVCEPAHTALPSPIALISLFSCLSPPPHHHRCVTAYTH